MTPEIKTRVAQIRRGEVPEGYKKSKVGIIPSDWNAEEVIKHIQEYRELSNDIDIIPVYSSSRKGLMPQSEYYDQKQAVETNIGYKVVPRGYVTYRHMSDDDIFHFNMNQTDGPVLVSSEYPVFTSSKETNLYFLMTLLNNASHFRYFCRTQKLGGTRTRLYLKNLGKYRFACPSFAEQQKIASILTMQDKVIELKEKLLREKQRQKKALMQQLLTGKKRLPGFSEKWETKKISDVFTITRGQVLATSEISKEDTDKCCYPVFSSQTKNRGLLGYYDKYLYEDAITWTTDGANAGNTNFRKGKFFCTNVCGVLLDNLGNANQCVAEMLNTVTKYYVSYVGNPKLMNNVMGEITLKFPPLDEQTAIAEILSTADREIDLLQKEIEQEKQKKKALMQMLLTGIVRV